MPKNKIVINVDNIRTDTTVYQSELNAFGKKGLKALLENIIERYFHSEYYDPDLVKEISKNRKEYD